MDRFAEKYLRKEKIPSTTCSGCGLGQVHKKIIVAIDELGLGIPDIVWGTGIGCAGRQTFNTWKGDNFAGTHGRVYALATGLRVSLPPQRKIIITAGDGDAFGIGLLHLLHCARRNVDMTVIVADNFGYQSTGGQFGYTTPIGYKTVSSPYGVQEANWLQNGIDILEILKNAGAAFLARHISFEGRAAVDSVKKAIDKKGFTLVHFIYPCVTNFGGAALGSRDPAKSYDWIKSLTRPDSPLYIKTGVFHESGTDRPEFAETLRALTAKVGSGHV